MAISNKKSISGSLGPVYYRTLNGKTIIQSKPGKVRQAESTKAAGRSFGRISSTSKNIRNALSPVLLGMHDAQMYRRFTARVYQAAMADGSLPKEARSLLNGDLPALAHFEFNAASTFGDYCSVALTLRQDTAGAAVSIAPFGTAAIAAPRMAAASELHLLAVWTDAAGMCTAMRQHHLDIVPGNSHNEGLEWVLDLPQQGQLLFVAAAVFFFKDVISGRISLNSRELHPCKLLGVVGGG